LQLLQAKHTSLLLQTLAIPWLLTFIYRLDVAEFAESSNLAKMLSKTNFHRLQKNYTSNGMFCLFALLLYPWVVVFIHRRALAALLGWQNSDKNADLANFLRV